MFDSEEIRKMIDSHFQELSEALINDYLSQCSKFTEEELLGFLLEIDQIEKAKKAFLLLQSKKLQVKRKVFNAY